MSNGCGIYKILNKLNGKYYVGSSKDIFGNPDGRWNKHRQALRSQKHHSDYLQRAWNKYGEEAFELKVVEELNENELKIVEQKYLDIAKLEREKCYNASFVATGGRCEPEAMKKIIGYWTEERRKERSEKMKGKNNPFYGKDHSDKVKQDCGNRFRGTTLTEESRKKRARYGKDNHFFGNTHDQKTIKGISVTRKRQEKIKRLLQPTPSV